VVEKTDQVEDQLQVVVEQEDLPLELLELLVQQTLVVAVVEEPVE
jgi:hypothetical protein